MGQYSSNQELIDIGEDIYTSIHALQNNSWAIEWLNHEKAKDVKKIYLKLLFKSYRLCNEASKNKNITRKDFEMIFDEYIEITIKLQYIEADVKVKEFLNVVMYGK